MFRFLPSPLGSFFGPDLTSNLAVVFSDSKNDFSQTPSATFPAITAAFEETIFSFLPVLSGQDPVPVLMVLSIALSSKNL